MKVATFLRSANTHFVAYVGLGFGAFGGLINFLIANPQVSATLLGILPPDVRPIVGTSVTLAGLILAYFGRPKTVPPSDKTQVAMAEAVGAPRPVTPAKP